MANQPLVSAIIIFYNAEKFISEAIESVISQSYTNWELILADDGSSDTSIDIAHKYTKLYPGKIHYIEHPGHKNHGMSATRNLGLRHAKGDYIAFLDSDDIWLSHKLTEQIQIMQDNPQAGMVCGAVKNWFSWGENVVREGRDDFIKPIDAPQDTLIMPPHVFDYLYPLQKGMPPTPSDLMLKKEVIKKIGGCEERFRKQYQLYEDQGFLNKIYLYFPVYVSSKNWILYRHHYDSISSTVARRGQYLDVRKYFLTWFKTYLKQNGFKGTEVWFLVEKALEDYRRPLSHHVKQFFAALTAKASKKTIKKS